MQFDRSAAQSEFKPIIRIPVQLCQHLISGLIVVRELQSQVCSIGMIDVGRIVLQEGGEHQSALCQSIMVYLVIEFIFTSAPQECQDLKYSKH